jgi:hypothetical protein
LFRRFGLILLIWMLITGGSEFRCSFSSDPNDDDELPRPPEDGNRAPQASDAAYSGPDDQEIRGLMPAVDPDGDLLNWSVVSGPSLGSLRDLDSRRGTFTYVPQATGSDSFAFRANDGRLDSNLANVRIAVLPAAVQVPSPVAQMAPDPVNGGIVAGLENGQTVVLDSRARAHASYPGSVKAQAPTPPGALALAAEKAGAGRIAVFGPSPRLAWSEDRGRSWRAARVPPGVRPTGVTWPANGLLVASAQESAGVRLLISKDGGRSWHPGPGWPGEAGLFVSSVPDARGGLLVALASREGTTIWLARLPIEGLAAWQ